MDLITRQSWLAEAPKFTTFRINSLKSFDPNNLKECLETVSYTYLLSQQLPS